MLVWNWPPETMSRTALEPLSAIFELRVKAAVPLAM